MSLSTSNSVAVVYHSGFGHTKFVADHIVKGLNADSKVKVSLYSVTDIIADNKLIEKLDGYTTIVFGSPTYMGSVSADFKKFMDLTSTVWYGQKWKNKLAAGFTNSNGLSGDKLNTLTSLSIFAAQHSMLWISHGVFPTDGLNRIGSWLGLMTQAQNEAPEKSFDPSDLRTAEAFGKRIAEVTAKYKI